MKQHRSATNIHTYLFIFPFILTYLPFVVLQHRWYWIVLETVYLPIYLYVLKPNVSDTPTVYEQQIFGSFVFPLPLKGKPAGILCKPVIPAQHSHHH